MPCAPPPDDRRVDVVIPARAGSSRFPNKPLARLRGRSMVERVWRLARAVPGVTRVVVASDDDAILAHARAFGADVAAVYAPCRNGSERTARAVAQLGDAAPIVVNLQGDAPLTPPHAVAAAIELLRRCPEAQLATPAVVLDEASYARYCRRKEAGRSSGTTVVCDARGRALYFSKNVLPRLRKRPTGVPLARQHVGLYAFRRGALETYLTLPPTPLEGQEQLEQLRWLEHGHALHVVDVPLHGRSLWSIDHPEDLEVAEELLAREGELVC